VVGTADGTVLYNGVGIRYIGMVATHGGGSMSARFTEIETSVGARRPLEARLDAYPELRAKVEGLVDIIENAGGDIEKAAVAEQRVIEAIRTLGHDVLAQWALQQQATQAAACQARPGVHRKEKKRSTGTRGSGRSRS
jgi:hypothetical protein